jgi:hypothetical protein
MEHGTQIDSECYEYMLDQNYNRYVGWDETGCHIQEFYSPETVKLISAKVTELTDGVDERNRKIVVPDQSIINVMNSIESSYRPSVGDIHTRYNVPKGAPTDYKQEMIDQTIQMIVNDIKINLGMEQNNAKLTAWTTVYGDFNEHGLRGHDIIKVRNKKPASIQFNMNY